MYCTGTLIRPW